MTTTIGGTTGVTFPDASTQNTAATGFGFKNRIINGAMVIDQRNAGASVTQSTATQFPVDRWAIYGSVASKFTAQQSTTAPTGFKNSVVYTSLSAYSVGASDRFQFRQAIEGFNVADLGWGTASAATVTLSFWVRSSLTGTFGGSFGNAAGDRSYPFSYTISAANTWTQISVTVAGDTTGTWLTDNSGGLWVYWGLGAGATYSGTAGSWSGNFYITATGATSVVGTSGATFYITGVQLEKGSTATSFDYRPYGTELALCQRYYFKTTPEASARVVTLGYNSTTTIHNGVGSFPVQMRTTPTSLEQSGTASDYGVAYLSTSATASAVPAFDSRTSNTMYVVQFTLASGLTAGQASRGQSLNANGYLAWSAEL